jgi:mono/diheme cytochrome c family protein
VSSSGTIVTDRVALLTIQSSTISEFAMNRWVRRSLYVVGGLAGVVVLAGLGVNMSASSKLSKKYESIPLVELPIPSDSATLERGKYLATAIGKCTECHSPDFGGGTIIDSPELGTLSASNLTRGGVGAQYTDAEMIRVIRHGVKRDSTGALIMPCEDWIGMADDDVTAIVAYIRSMPDVTRELKPFELKPLGTALVGTGALPLIKVGTFDHSTVPPKSMVPDSTVEYGKYLADIGGCTGCHGPGLTGGPIPGAPPEMPPAANLTPTGIGHYSDAELETILRTGKRPDGTAINDFMPWMATALMSPTDMRATIKFLRTVTPREFGNR